MKPARDYAKLMEASMVAKEEDNPLGDVAPGLLKENLELQEKCLKLEANLKFMGATVKPNGDMEINMPEYHHSRCKLCPELDRLRREVERLKGIQPELGPRPPDIGDGIMHRYGIRWNGPETPIAVPMDDGYWTPYHVARNASEHIVRSMADEILDVLEVYTGIKKDGPKTD